MCFPIDFYGHSYNNNTNITTTITTTTTECSNKVSHTEKKARVTDQMKVTRYSGYACESLKITKTIGF